METLEMNWTDVLDADAVPPGGVVRVATTAGAVAVYRLQDGYYATQNQCTHARVGSMADGFVEGDEIECPLHAARFCIRTGAVRSAPATRPLKTFPVKVEAGRVHVALPEEAPAASPCANPPCIPGDKA